MNLDADDDQLEFPVLYASAKNGWAVTDIERDETKPDKVCHTRRLPCANPCLCVSLIGYETCFRFNH